MSKPTLILPQRPGLGRHHAPDDRDRRYPLRAAMAPTPRPRRAKIWPLFAPWHDQGRTGMCVEYAWTHYLIGTPKPMRAGLPTLGTIYDWAIAHDEFPDNDRDTARQLGTSVRAGAKALQSLGLISEYRWAASMADVIDWLGYEGGLVTGFNWYSSMFDRDQGNFLRIAPGATVVGGHATYAHRWDERRGAVGLYTSWRDFGPFLLAGEDFERLLHENGECCAATEVPHGKAVTR